ncbi:MAG: alpha/beta hydrolase [Caldilineaceae bacterium]
MNIETNIVYGMYSGLALLLDIYRPAQANGFGIIHISGSGWSAPLGLDARPLKASPHVAIEGKPLVEAGYTLFSINHRATPRFQYPAAVEDAQRAVRFVRYHAEQFGIDAERIGAIGGSSGGHLVSLLGLLPGAGDADDESPINRVSARVQCMVTRAAPSNFLADFPGRGAPALFLGASVTLDSPTNSVEYRRAQAASPITYVTADAPPYFLIHGDADDVVPIAQSERMEAALRAAGVPVQCRRVAGGGHGPGIMDDAEIAQEVVAWFERYLRRA